MEINREFHYIAIICEQGHKLRKIKTVGVGLINLLLLYSFIFLITWKTCIFNVDIKNKSIFVFNKELLNENKDGLFLSGT